MFRPKYKCLMCGAYEYGNPVETEEEASKMMNRTLYLGGQFGAPEAFKVHHCTPASIGVMALVGYVGGFKKEADKY